MSDMGVYKITSPSGKFYIGSSVDIKKRWYSHKRDMKLQSHHCSPMNKVFSKYGLDNLKFEIIEYVLDRSKLLDIEQYWMDLLKPEYNVSLNSKHCMHNPEVVAKVVSKTTGQKRSVEQKKRMSQSHLNRTPISEETREKLRLSSTGRKHSLESRLKISNKAIGRKPSQLAIDNRIKSVYEKRKFVKDRITGEIYGDIADTAKLLAMSKCSVIRLCNGVKDVISGQRLEYV